MTPEEARLATIEHIKRVGHFLNVVAGELRRRATLHDATKLQSPEFEMFAGNTGQLNGLTYGSDEYEAQRKKMLGEALGHHYENNRHHPEHFEQGVDDMTLIDLMEMFCDWKAATERHADGDIFKSIEHNTGRFGLSEQLAQILRNTVKELE